MSAAPRLRWPRRLWRRPSGQGEAWQEGLRMMLDRFDHVLQGRGVQAMRLVGQPFDPQLARAIGTAADPAAADGLVLEEVPRWLLLGEPSLAHGGGDRQQDRRRPGRTVMTANIVGIDLGTTNSEIALYVDGRPRVLGDEREPADPALGGGPVGDRRALGRRSGPQPILVASGSDDPLDQAAHGQRRARPASASASTRRRRFPRSSWPGSRRSPSVSSIIRFARR